MIELTIDPEFRDLIPPLTEEEYKGLEESLLTNGFDETQPIIIWKDHNIVVDGHNRYEICVKHDIEPVTLEREFESRYDVIKWMLDLQLNRRSPNKKKRTYVIGRRYIVERNENGGDRKSVYQNDKLIPETHKRIAAQLNIGSATVTRAAEFTEAVDTIVRVTGIKVNDILDDKIKGDMKDIVELAGKPNEVQNRIIELIQSNKCCSIDLAFRDIEREEHNRTFEEAEVVRKQMEAKLAQEREEKEKAERERLRIEREAFERREKARLEVERAENERRRLEALEVLKRERAIAEKKAQTDAEQERIRKEKVEQIRIAEEKAKLERIEQEKAERARLEKLRVEKEKADEEKLIKARLEQEKLDTEKIEAEHERIRKEKALDTPYDPYIQCCNRIVGDITLLACRSKRSLYRFNVQVELEDPVTLSKNWEGKVWLDVLETEKDVKLYMEKLIMCWLNQSITEAFVITKNDTEAEWFRQLMQKANAVVFPLKGKLRNHALVYFGKNTEIFMKECEKFGWGVVLKN